MIRVIGLSDASRRYLLDDPAREVNDLFGSRAPGVWTGSGASALSLEGPVEALALQSVLAGHPPGSTLRGSPRRSIVADDVIIAAPKSVSAAFAIAERREARAVVECHQHAIEVAVGYLEQRALGVRRRDPSGADVLVPIDGAIAASFVHGTSRSGDPHLHSHVLMANLARDTSGRFGALDRRGLRAHARATDALYRAQLRWNLAERLGVLWLRGHDGRERISGIDEAALVAFSGRSAEASAHEHRRPEKRPMSRDDAEILWRRRLEMAPVLDGLPRSSPDPEHLDEHRFAQIVHRDVPRARSVVEAWADSAAGGIDATLIAEGLRRAALPSGAGVMEPPLAPRSVLPTVEQLRTMGPRPVRRPSLERWWELAQGRARDQTRDHQVSDHVHRSL